MHVLDPILVSEGQESYLTHCGPCRGQVMGAQGRRRHNPVHLAGIILILEVGIHQLFHIFTLNQWLCLEGLHGFRDQNSRLS